MSELEYYWNSIPIGKDKAITYPELCELWRMSERTVRRTLHDLSYWDNNDPYILIRSGRGKGFYRTTDETEIELYRRECMNKAKRMFAPIRKIKRVMREKVVQGEVL